MKKDVRVVAVQARVPKTKQEGEEQVSRVVHDVMKEPADMIGLHEDCLATYDEVKAGYDGFAFLSSVAKEYSVYLFGATAVLTNGHLHNRGFLFDRSGSLVASHDKVVLTPGEAESGVIAGRTLEVFDTEFGKMAILVCKDSFHRYAAWFFDGLRKAGVDVILIPSYSLNVSKRSTELWVDALKALAKWFDVYVVAPGTVGPNATEYPSFGHALILCPNRVVLAEGSSDREELLRATLDVTSLEDIRNTYGSKWQPDRVPDVDILVRQ